MKIGQRPDGGLVVSRHVETAAYARAAATEVTDAGREVIVEAGGDLGDVVIGELVEAGVEEVRVRSVLTCDVGGRHLRQVLRAVAGHRQARGHRRGGRHHRRTVDRRARHPADHADVPHRRRRG